MSNAPASISTDIYTLVEDGLWFILNSHPDFIRNFKPGNRIKFTDGDPDPGKPSQLDADRPEVRIVTAGPTNEQSQTTSSTDRTIAYQVIVDTTARTTNRIGGPNQLMDIIDRAFRAWGDVMLGVPQVRKIRVGPAQKTTGEQRGDQGGWTVTPQITVTLAMPTWEMEMNTWR